MDKLSVLPDRSIIASGVGSKRSLHLGIDTFLKACRLTHELPYGCNSDKDDLMILFKEKIVTSTDRILAKYSLPYVPKRMFLKMAVT